VAPVLQNLKVTLYHCFQNIRNYVRLALDEEIVFVKVGVGFADFSQRLRELCLLEDTTHDVGHLVGEKARRPNHWILTFVILHFPVDHFIDVLIVFFEILPALKKSGQGRLVDRKKSIN